MAKVDLANIPPDAWPRVRGAFLVKAGIYGPYAAKWPRKAGPPKTPAQQFTSAQFGIAARMAANSEPVQFETAREMTKGTDWLPRDLLTLAAYGKAYELFAPDGTPFTQADHGYPKDTPPPPPVGPAATRYFRLYITEGFTSTVVRLSEIEIFIDPDGPPLALSVISADSSAPSRGPEKAIDGGSNFWQSGAGFPYPHWLLLDFGPDAEVPVYRVDLTAKPGFNPHPPKTFAFQTAPQDDPGTFTESWAPPSQTSWGAGSTKTFLFPDT